MSDKAKFEKRNVEEDIERLDVTEVLCIDKVLDKPKNKGKTKISFDKKDLISCPELN